MIKNNLVKIQMIRMHIDSDEYNNNGDETIISILYYFCKINAHYLFKLAV